MRHQAIAAALALLAFAACGSAEGRQSSGGSDAGGPGFEKDGFTLDWEITGDSMLVSISAPTTGWIAVGFHATAAMKDADILIGYVDASGAHLRDDFGTDYTRHQPDTELGGSSDFSGLEGSETGGVTTLSFVLPLSSGDSRDRPPVPGQPCSVILATGSDGNDSFGGMHQWAETVELTF
ncbi:DOMON domain-containing protein [Candidatus Fermentibacteria bacterium]|nr:DOMON domain-containing protein [Candidatus Fermentibacteria bacterium]